MKQHIFLARIVAIVLFYLLCTRIGAAQDLLPGVHLASLQEAEEISFSRLYSRVNVWGDGSADHVLEQTVSSNSFFQTISEIGWTYD
ncbi:MAG: hypothetical protein IT329_24310 [Caldilineaceae bacterium]|nr:hypothetical protein [Caldilineaceae bacterium]